MLKSSPVKPLNLGLIGDVHAESWEHALEAAVSVLKEIDKRYAYERARIDNLIGENASKQRLLEQLETRCRKDREPYVLHIADVYQRMTLTSLFRTVH